MPPTLTPRAPHTISEDLRRDRLQHRERRLTRVVAALEDRVRQHREGPPRPLRQAAADFSRELHHVQAQLRRLAHPR